MTVTGNVFHDPLSSDFLHAPLVLVSNEHVLDSKVPLQLQILPATQSATNNRYIVATVADFPQPLYWWTWMDGGIKLFNASGFVASDIGEIKQSNIKESDIVCQLARKGMLTTKWTLHNGTDQVHVYRAKDKVIKGKQLELSMELVMNEKQAEQAPDSYRMVTATVNGAGNKMSVHVDKQVAARATREGQLEIAPGVDVVGAIAALALAHTKSREEGRRFFEWEGTALRLIS
ncbi:hypothetical protein BCR44DRAFT_33808 [Catenaria anguillulae PL171]|uniref:Uncharacterized protein n=1 Tax=Catenaria anguillulae PL171 TaxID=765915 RepID=A0A1Y2HMY9_9FUNG|nr:hypothetical protein BCR44DRAFT_33808 [Catenaria anguillulae PL171]